MQDRADERQDGCRTGQMQDRIDAGKDECWTGQIPLFELKVHQDIPLRHTEKGHEKMFI